MLERTGLKSLFSLALAAGVIAVPVSGNAQGSVKPAAQSTQSTSAAKASSTATSATERAKPRKEPTEAQLAARERRVRCGAEWRDAKKKGALEEGATWPKYWSACNKRLKEQGA
jgi:hypothetical protein